MFEGRAGAVPVPVGVNVLFDPPIIVRASSVVVELVTVVLDLPVMLDDAFNVIVANVLPSKSEGTVGMGPKSPRVRVLAEPLNVTTTGDGEELLWAAAKHVSHNDESIVPFILAGGCGGLHDMGLIW